MCYTEARHSFPHIFKTLAFPQWIKTLYSQYKNHWPLTILKVLLCMGEFCSMMIWAQRVGSTLNPRRLRNKDSPKGDPISFMINFSWELTWFIIWEHNYDLGCKFDCKYIRVPFHIKFCSTIWYLVNFPNYTRYPNNGVKIQILR